MKIARQMILTKSGMPKSELIAIAPRKQHGADFDENVDQQNQSGEDSPRRRPVAMLEELRHGVEAVAKIEGQEYPQQRVEAEEYRAPFDGHGDEASGIGRAHDADEMVARYIGRHDAAADHPPRQFVAGQKIIALGGLALASGVHAHAHHDDDVGGKDPDVDSAQFHNGKTPWTEVSAGLRARTRYTPASIVESRPWGLLLCVAAQIEVEGVSTLGLDLDGELALRVVLLRNPFF